MTDRQFIFLDNGVKDDESADDNEKNIMAANI
jgi:hypothetical protein